MATRLDKARRLLHLASPQQRGLMLKEIVNKNNDRQKVWIRDRDSKKGRPKPGGSIQGALPFRTPQFAPKEAVRPKVNYDETITSAIADGQNLLSPYVKDKSKVEELQERLDGLSRTIHPIQEKKKSIDERINKARKNIILSMEYSFGAGRKMGFDWSEEGYKVDHDSFLQKTKEGLAIAREMTVNDKSGSLNYDYDEILKHAGELESRIKEFDEVNEAHIKAMAGVKSLYDEALHLLDHEGLMNEVSKRSGLSAEEAKNTVDRLNISDSDVEGSGYPAEKIKEWLREGMRIMGQKIKIKSVTSSDGYALYSDGHICVENLRSDYPESSREVLLHEMAHSVEDINPHVLDLTYGWVKSRNPEAFFDPYVPTVYPTRKGIRATEVVSTGMEMLCDHRNAAELLIRDPEHLAITLKALTM